MGSMPLYTELEKLEGSDLVRRLSEQELAYLFKHALVQDTAYASLLKHDRKELHRFVAESLEHAYPERLDENAGLLAYHYTQCGNDVKIFEYATRAANVAAKVFAHAEARAYYSQALAAIVN